MGEFEEVKKGVVKRKQRRAVGLFIDGTGLDRATRRLKRKIDLPKLVKGVVSGARPIIARYYTLIPYEDDSRQRAYLDAVRRAGLQVLVKRLPPKGVNRQVMVDVEMAADIVAFALGHTEFSSLGQYLGEEDQPKKSARQTVPLKASQQLAHTPSENESEESGSENNPQAEPSGVDPNAKRVITVVCPSKELSYPLSLATELGADTVNADFGQFSTKDVLKSAAKWIDLSDSETIWRE